MQSGTVACPTIRRSLRLQAFLPHWPMVSLARSYARFFLSRTRMFIAIPS